MCAEHREKNVICLERSERRKNSKYLEARDVLSNIDFVITSKAEDKSSFTNVLLSKKPSRQEQSK